MGLESGEAARTRSAAEPWATRARHAVLLQIQLHRADGSPALRRAGPALRGPPLRSRMMRDSRGHESG